MDEDTQGGIALKTLPPTVPVTAMGTLGLVHMPRMWAKALLHARGQLAEGYQPGCFFDRTLMSGLGIDPDQALAYLTSELPSYQAFEAWVLEQVGGRIDPAVAERVNATILHHELDEAERRQFQAEVGLPEDSPIRSTAVLDDLDDLIQFHRLLLAD